MKDSQPPDYRVWAHDKYIKESNERFSTQLAPGLPYR